MLLRKGELLSLDPGVIWYIELRNEQCQEAPSAEQLLLLRFLTFWS